MATLTSIIKFLTYFAVLFTLIEFYLKVNKIWKRRSEPEVAASQSLIALAIGGFTSIIWVANYILSNDWEGVGEYTIFLAETLIMMAIGTGIFVKISRDEKVNLWGLIKKSLRLEKDEASFLLNTIMKPKNCDLVLRILYKIAMIDNEYAENEKIMLEAFAKEWDLEIEDIYNTNLNEQCRFMQIKEDFETYLKLSPPKEQVAQLKDLVNSLVTADDTVAREEQMILDEVIPMLDIYLDDKQQKPQYLVIIVPQTEEQMQQTACISPNVEKIHSAGGVAYEVESFNSKLFAELMCDKYREQGLFTTVLDYKAKIKGK